jgi:hypothetical protein
MVTKQKLDAALRREIIARSFEDAAFREQLLKDPKNAIEKAFNIQLPADVKFRVLEDTETTMHLVLPVHSEEIVDEEATSIAGGTGRIVQQPGSLRPKTPPKPGF